MHTIFWTENLIGKDHLEDLGVDVKVIFAVSYRNRVGRCGLDSSGSG
jgi:hypothetical protein